MTEAAVHGLLVWAMFALAALTFAALFLVTAPYGRHSRAGWGPEVSARLAWVLMESPAVLAFLAVFLLGAQRSATVPLVLAGLWLLHYLQRTFVYPFRIRSAGRKMALSIAAMAFVFNLLNAYINARWVSQLGSYGVDWLLDPRFLSGAALMLIGWLINVHSDTILVRLRAPGESGYKIPRGGLYRWVSCPNYFGELLEWLGWALATWSTAGLAFAVYTAANLVPRALAHHRWYQERFDDYPAERKAVVPLVL